MKLFRAIGRPSHIAVKLYAEFSFSPNNFSDLTCHISACHSDWCALIFRTSNYRASTRTSVGKSDLNKTNLYNLTANYIRKPEPLSLLIMSPHVIFHARVQTMMY